MDRKPRWWKPVAAAFATAILVIGLAGSALATPVTFYFEGEVFHADPALTGSVSLGDPFSGSYTFDDATAGFPPGGSFVTYSGAVTSLSFATGSLTGSASTGDIYVQDFFIGDFYEVTAAGSGPFGPAFSFFDFHLIARDLDVGIFVDALLPTDPSFLLDPAFDDGPPDLAAIEVQFFDGSVLASLSATIDRVSTEPFGQVPEPATVAVFGFGLAGLWWLRRRRAA